MLGPTPRSGNVGSVSTIKLQWMLLSSGPNLAVPTARTRSQTSPAERLRRAFCNFSIFTRQSSSPTEIAQQLFSRPARDLIARALCWRIIIGLHCICAWCFSFVARPTANRPGGRCMQAGAFLRRNGAHGLGHVGWSFEYPDGTYSDGGVENRGGMPVS